MCFVFLKIKMQFDSKTLIFDRKDVNFKIFESGSNVIVELSEELNNSFAPYFTQQHGLQSGNEWKFQKNDDVNRVLSDIIGTNITTLYKKQLLVTSQLSNFIPETTAQTFTKKVMFQDNEILLVDYSEYSVGIFLSQMSPMSSDRYNQLHNYLNSGVGLRNERLRPFGNNSQCFPGWTIKKSDDSVISRLSEIVSLNIRELADFSSLKKKKMFNGPENNQLTSFLSIPPPQQTLGDFLSTQQQPSQQSSQQIVIPNIPQFGVSAKIEKQESVKSLVSNLIQLINKNKEGIDELDDRNIIIWGNEEYTRPKIHGLTVNNTILIDEIIIYKCSVSEK